MAGGNAHPPVTKRLASYLVHTYRNPDNTPMRKQIAAMLQVPGRTLDHWIGEGLLPPIEEIDPFECQAALALMWRQVKIEVVPRIAQALSLQAERVLGAEAGRDARDHAIALGTLWDKLALGAGDATQRSEMSHRHAHVVVRLPVLAEEEYARLARMAQAALMAQSGDASLRNTHYTQSPPNANDPNMLALPASTSATAETAQPCPAQADDSTRVEGCVHPWQAVRAGADGLLCATCGTRLMTTPCPPGPEETGVPDPGGSDLSAKGGV